MPRLFTTPFASGGDKVVVPDAPQPSGSVSYSEGFTLDYELENTDPDYKPVPRDGMNGLFCDLTDAVGSIQAKGFTAWSNLINYTTPAIVFGSNGLPYIALQASGPSTTPRDPISNPTYWQQFALHGAIYFTTTGVTNWSVPLAMQLGIIKPEVTVIAAGGGASRISATATGGGGGGGGAAVKIVDLTGVTTVAVTVGLGGAGKDGSSFGDGTAGGSSSFGAYCSATGGIGGVIAGTRVAGGNGTGGDINYSGQQGGASQGGGQGGNSPFFPGGQTGGITTSAPFTGANGVGPGGGGAGGNPSSTAGAGAGGNGANGIVIVRW